jgi:autotransporter-associated beta strand protein
VVDVTVQTAGGTSAKSPADRFTYGAVPTVTAVSPTNGPAAGGTSVWIIGTNFVNGATAVDFGTIPATSVTVVSSTWITAISPAGTGVVDVTAVTSAGTSAKSSADQFSYGAVPTVLGISPAIGPVAGGTSVWIIGANFVAGATTVDFGGNPATSVVVESPTWITATSPAGTAGTVDVTVTTSAGPSPISSADQFIYGAVPTVAAISAAEGPVAGGTSLWIIGTDFSAATAVDFAATPASNVEVVSDTLITATSPAGTAGTVDVTVVNPVGASATSAADQFTYDSVPTVTAISSSAGPLVGGTPVTITGANFTASATVDFGITPAIAVTVMSSTQISATSPGGTPGTVDVTVATPGGASATSAADQFTYDDVPTVTAISSGAGPFSGGTAVTISGTNFVAPAMVDFGASGATGVTVVSPTQITATSPAGTAGAVVDVTVVTAGGNSDTSPADQFTYAGVPAVTGVSPAAGPLAGGTLVTISGTNFVSPATVDFGATAASGITVVSPTQITATSPAGAVGTVHVSVATPGGTSTTSSADQFTYADVPTVTMISPAVGPVAGGTSVTITGTNFTGATEVDFDVNPASSVTVVSPTRITATSPAGVAGMVDVTVVTPGGVSDTSSADQFTYADVPMVTGVSPAGGPAAGGTLVTISGTNFVAPATVDFGKTPATGVTVVSLIEITATSPAGAAGTADVTVSTPGGVSATSSADQFAYAALPAVTAISPAAGPATGGLTVTITGTEFTGATEVDFGTTPASNVEVVSDTQITATSPAGAVGTVHVTVVTPGGVSTTSSADQFTYADVPTVTAVSPANGSTAGGTLVTITGTNFTGATEVVFGTALASSFTVVSPTQITATSPAGTAGAIVDVTVVTGGGPSDTSSADQFTFGVSMLVAPADWTSAGLTLTVGSDGNLHVYKTYTNTDVVTACAPSSVANITITAPSPTAANLTIDSTNGDPIPAGGLNYSGAGGLIITGPGIVILSNTDTYTGGTTVSTGALLIGTRNALPSGGRLTIGAGGAFVFDPSQSVSSFWAAGVASPVPDAGAASETSAPIVAAAGLADAAVTASTLSTAISATSGSPANTPVDFATSATTAMDAGVQCSLAVAAPSGTHAKTDMAARAASVFLAKAAPSATMPIAMSSVVRDAVFASHRPAIDRTISCADIAQSARAWAWLAATESPWNSSDQNRTTDSEVAARDEVLARYEL